MPYLRCIVLFQCVVFLLAGQIAAHEGHQPLPTKGVQLDLENRHITLSKHARTAIGVEAIELQELPVATALEAYAETVVPWNAKAFVSAQISGKIARLYVKPGDSVCKDQVLAELTSRDLELLKLDYQQARQDFALSDRILAMTRPSAAAGAIPSQRLFDAENTHQQNANRLEIARIRGAILGIDEAVLSASSSIPVYAIRAPIDGRIVHTDLSEGKFVEADEHLFEIVDTSELWARIQLLEKDLTRVRAGQSVDLAFLESDDRLRSTIDSVDIRLDPRTQNGWAWLTLQSHNALPGMVGTATIQTDHADHKLVVPHAAVYSDGLQHYVFVEEASTKESSEYRAKFIRVGKRSVRADGREPQWEVLGGDVFPGDRIVVRGGHELSSLFFLGALKLDNASRQRLGLRIEQATVHSISKTILAPAVVSLPPENRSVLSSQIAGNIRAISAQPGQRVKRGDVLMEVAGTELQTLQLSLLQSSLEAQLFRSRYQQLESGSADVASPRTLIETLARAEQLEAKVASLKAQLSTLGFSLVDFDSLIQDKHITESLPIRASMDGYVSNFIAMLGQNIAANQPLLELQNLDQVWIEASLPIQDTSSVQMDSIGQVHLLADASVLFPARVVRVGPVINETTRVRQVWLMSDSKPEFPSLREGMLATVQFQGDSLGTAITVPNSALVRDGIHWFVFVQDANGHFERRRVTIGRRDIERSEVKTGVMQGEAIVVSGSRELQTAFAALR